jgi:Spy/CpxP family protein refolding chaperone
MSTPAPVEGGDQSRGRWWFNATVQHELGLSPAQVKALESTFARGLPERLALRRELNRRDAQLQQLLERGDADEAVVERCIVQVEEVRARRNVQRTLMLLKMYRILTPLQRLALSKMRVDTIQTAGQHRRSVPAH